MLAESPAAEPGDIPQVLRRATLQDQSQAGENELFARWLGSAVRKIRELNLNAFVESTVFADRTVIQVLYAAEERVDFRQLVQHLAADLHARIEMRQIGTRSMADDWGYAPAGGLCCSVWLKKFDNVTMRMAKQQGLTLNPVNLNGMCGRLKCCLRFEHACYTEKEKESPG